MRETEQLVRRLKALADARRLQIIKEVSRRSVCVCEMEDLLGLTQPAVSHHLRILREAELIKDERRGKWIFYSLHRENYNNMMEILASMPAAVPGNEEAMAAKLCGTCVQVQKKQ